MTHFTAQLKDLDIKPRVYQKLFLQLQKWRALAHLFIPPPEVDVTTGEDIMTSTAPPHVMVGVNQFGPQQTPSPHQTLVLPVAAVVSSNLENDINSSGDSSDSSSSHDDNNSDSDNDDNNNKK